MSEAPILFSTPLVRAILDGRKTQTRRLPRGEVSTHGGSLVVRDRRAQWNGPFALSHPTFERLAGLYPVGTRLWVRETWAAICPTADPYCQCGDVCQPYFEYRADTTEKRPGGWDNCDDPDEIREFAPRWRPSIHMKREAARLLLRVTGARLERLQDISDADIRAEGVEAADGLTLRETWARLWDGIYAGRDLPYRPTAWGRNPWVIVYEFEVIR